MPENGKSKESERHLESLMKGLQVLDCLQGHPALTITEIANELGLYKSRVMRICGTLEHMGYVVYDAKERVYRLGPRIPALARSYEATNPLLGVVKPFLESIFSRLRQSVAFHRAHGNTLMCIYRLSPKADNHDQTPMWQDRSFHCGARGRVMLAFGDRALREQYFSRAEPYPMLTPHTITDPAELERAVELVKGQGYAITSQERIMGGFGIAAPVLQYADNLIGVISISGNVQDFDEELVNKAVPILQEETRKLSLRLGAECHFLQKIEQEGVTR